MLDGFMIHEIRKREREKQHRQDELRLPVGPPPEPRRPQNDDRQTPPQGSERGVRHYDM